MLTHPTTNRLRELGLAGMAKALEEQRNHADAADLSWLRSCGFCCWIIRRGAWTQERAQTFLT